MLKQKVSETLRNTFGDVVRLDFESRDFAVFAAKHPSVGDVVIEENYGELIVFVGNITHGHFGSYEADLSEAEHVAVITQNLVGFLQHLFDDKYLLFKAPWGGGWTLPEHVKERKLKSRSRQWFKWSGPVDFSKNSN